MNIRWFVLLFAFAQLGWAIPLAMRARHHCEVVSTMDIIRERDYQLLPEVRETIEAHNAKVRWVCWGIPTILESP